MGSMDWEMAGGMQPPLYKPEGGQDRPEQHVQVSQEPDGEKQRPRAEDRSEDAGEDKNIQSKGDVLSLQDLSSSVRTGAIRRGRPLSWIWLALFVGGLLAGTAFINWQEWGNSGSSGSMMEETLKKMYDFSPNVGILVSIMIKRCGIFIFLAGITLLCRRSLVLYSSTAYFGFCFGAAISAMTIQYGVTGLWVFFKALLPHYLLYIPAYLMLLMWAQERYTGRIVSRRRWDRDSGGILALTGIMFIAGSVLECYVSPIWAAFLENL